MSEQTFSQIIYEGLPYMQKCTGSLRREILSFFQDHNELSLMALFMVKASPQHASLKDVVEIIEARSDRFAEENFMERTKEVKHGLVSYLTYGSIDGGQDLNVTIYNLYPSDYFIVLAYWL